MFRTGPRSVLFSFLFAVIFFGLQGCDDGTGPGQEAVTTQPVAEDLSAIRAGVITGDEIQDNTLSLSEVIACIMTNRAVTGLCGDLLGATAHSEQAAFGPGVENGDWDAPSANGEILNLVAPLGPPVLATNFSSLLSGPLLASPPFETTCVWDPTRFTNGFWKGDATDPFGPVPDRTVRFELNLASGGIPVEPLVPLGSYADVWIGKQQSEDNAIDVRVYTDPSVFPVITFPLQGSSIEGQVLNLFSNGGSIDNGVDIVDFGLTNTNTSLQIDASVRDYTITETTQGDFSGIRATTLLVSKSGDPSRSVLYSFEWSFAPSLNFPINSGTVTVDGHAVATISGTEGAPIFTLTDDSPLDPNERFDLTSIWIDARGFRNRVLDLYTMAHCIGADREGECSVMTTRLGGVS